MKILILLSIFLKLHSHVFAHPALSEVIHGAVGADDLGRGAGEIGEFATHGRPALQSKNLLRPLTSGAGDGKQSPEISDSLFGGRAQQSSASKDSSLAHNSGLVTDKNAADIFIHKPPPTYVPPTYIEVKTGKILPSILKPDQIGKLKPEQLVEYISNFNTEVKASRDTWRAADQAVKKAEDTLSHDALKAFAEKNKASKSPETADQVLQRIKNGLRQQLSLATIDEGVDTLALKQFSRVLGVSTEHLDSSIKTAREAKANALKLAEMRKTSGYPFMDKMKAAIQKLLAKVNFRLPWKKPAEPPAKWKIPMSRKLSTQFGRYFEEGELRGT
ncbi:uncharacterized protein MELLADRAFT_123447 [Melampsora larici-populina 98AG31]|uniref:Secreted protein n=1 Tax=Melampsora larici-populina (strain 98AG31 / pathotype 3-4-7) TaxID=747676 RepID=F4RMN7_MELLP|nr:uncharacterized protein MELLADRAFT_123447 [Melampsora larici-populina 98AG31]EGG06350.1 secreted protein [Melampsora larici-populina 98AG31]